MYQKPFRVVQEVSVDRSLEPGSTVDDCRHGLVSGVRRPDLLSAADASSRMEGAHQGDAVNHRTIVLAVGVALCLAGGGAGRSAAQAPAAAVQEPPAETYQQQMAREQREHPTLAIGAQAPDFALKGTDGRDLHAGRFRGQPDPRRRVHLEPLPRLPVVRSAHQADRHRLCRQGGKGGGDCAERSAGGGAPRAELQRRRRLVREHGHPCRASAVQLAVPLRRRYAGRRSPVRPEGHASHVHLRQGPEAPVRGTHRRQHAGQQRQEPGHSQRPRCARRRAPGSCRAHPGVRVQHEMEHRRRRQADAR